MQISQRAPTKPNSSIAQGPVKSLSGRTKKLAASIAFVIGIVSAWFIRDSVLL